MLYRLSKIVPVRMRTRYREQVADAWAPRHATWWQWRDHIWGHRVQHVS